MFAQMSVSKSVPIKYAALVGGSRFPSMVTEPDRERVLKAWKPSPAAMDKVPEEWRQMPMYSLTLEERRTCAESCPRRGACPGDKMPTVKRFTPGPALIAGVHQDLALLQRLYPMGFVVRLHRLGDFYSEEYVDRWVGWLCRFPGLNLIGKTSRDPKTDPIARKLAGLVELWEARWSMPGLAAFDGEDA